MTEAQFLGSSRHFTAQKRRSFPYLDFGRRHIGWLLRSLNQPELMDEAITILQTTSSPPDLREWAERYLCRMTSGSQASFLDRRHPRS
jgi:hypothetical protein